MDFVAWPKIPRWNKDWEITEKIDGTNGVLYWSEHPDGRFDGTNVLASIDGLHLYAGSRNRWLRTDADNFGFARWAQENAQDLISLGKGRHYGEWYGHGIQRGYGLNEKRFALFDTGKWKEVGDPRIPKGVDVVPIVGVVPGDDLSNAIELCKETLLKHGSGIAPSWFMPEGLIVKNLHSGARFKIVFGSDESKGGRGL